MKKVYHISRSYIGDNVLFTPRTPVSQNKSEIDMPKRICASDSIEKCWEGVRCCNDLVFEMKNNTTDGYYFFVYEFNADDFVKSPVFDAEKTGEVISTKMTRGQFSHAIYVQKHKLDNAFNEAVETATNQEAITAWNKWQKDDIQEIEDRVESVEWQK